MFICEMTWASQFWKPRPGEVCALAFVPKLPTGRSLLIQLEQQTLTLSLLIRLLSMRFCGRKYCQLNGSRSSWITSGISMDAETHPMSRRICEGCIHMISGYTLDCVEWGGSVYWSCFEPLSTRLSHVSFVAVCNLLAVLCRMLCKWPWTFLVLQPTRLPVLCYTHVLNV